MPAETHQRGRIGDRGDVVQLLADLLGQPAEDAPTITTLQSLGIDEDGIQDLWDAVREEFGERMLGPTCGADGIDSSMTIDEAAAAMTSLLVQDRRPDAASLWT